MTVHQIGLLQSQCTPPKPGLLYLIQNPPMFHLPKLSPGSSVLVFWSQLAPHCVDNTKNFMSHWQRQQLAMANKVSLFYFYMLFKLVIMTAQCPICVECKF